MGMQPKPNTVDVIVIDSSDSDDDVIMDGVKNNKNNDNHCRQILVSVQTIPTNANQPSNHFKS